MVHHEKTQYKTYLESVTTKELIKMADEAGIDVPEDLDRIFIIRELLDNAYDEESRQEDSSGDLSEVPDLKTAALPEQYHITYVDVLLRDPQWAYVFWEIKALDRERYEADPRFEGYALKVLENKKTREAAPELYKDGDFIESFTVTVGREDNSRYLGFPEAGMFRIALWLRGIDTAPAVSRAFSLPRFLNSPGNEAYFESPLVKLSGAADFAVLRSAERVPYSIT